MDTYKLSWVLETKTGRERKESAHFISEEAAHEFLQDVLRLQNLKGDPVIQKSHL